MVKDETTTVGESERERQDAAATDNGNGVVPGGKLAQTDPEAHRATYDEDGNLRIKSEKPLAGGESGEEVNLETALNAPADGVGTESVVEDVEEGDAHPKSEGSDKVEVKHPNTAEENDDANTEVADEPGSSVDTAGAVEAGQVDQDQSGSDADESGSDESADEGSDDSQAGTERQ